MTLNANELCDLVNYLIDNIFVKFGTDVFRQTVGIPMGTDCAPLLADLFLHYYEYKFMERLIKTKGTLYLARKFNKTFRYIDDLMSQNNPQFGDYVSEIYPPQLVLKETTNDLIRDQSPNIQRPVSYLDVLFYFDKEGVLCYKLYDKRDDFDFAIVNFPYICSNIPSSPAYGVYISQLVRYSRVCMFYKDFRDKHLELVNRLKTQGFTVSRLKTTFKKFYTNYEGDIKKYKKGKEEMLIDVCLFETGTVYGKFMYGLLNG